MLSEETGRQVDKFNNIPFRTGIYDLSLNPQKIIDCYRIFSKYLEIGSKKISGSGSQRQVNDLAFLSYHPNGGFARDLKILKEAAEKAKEGDIDYILKNRKKIADAMCCSSVGALWMELENDVF